MNRKRTFSKSFVIGLAFLAFFSSFVVVSCDVSGTPSTTTTTITLSDDYYRTIAWNFIDGDNQETIVGTKNDGIVSDLVTYESPSEETIQIKYCKIVEWNTTEDALLGPIGVKIDPDTGLVVGPAPRL